METKEQLIEDGKTIAIVAHITIIGLIIALILNSNQKNPFASYHIRQMIGLILTGIVLSAINIIPLLGQIIWFAGSLVLIYLWIMGLINAVNGQEKPMPILGEKYADWFKGI
ncbi:MAG: hypothetical protein RQ756_02875 [Flavobacteriaceae bacterium]|nr:hypothetical protein [Flavobacteriaceae bacterium]